MPDVEDDGAVRGGVDHEVGTITPSRMKTSRCTAEDPDGHPGSSAPVALGRATRITNVQGSRQPQRPFEARVIVPLTGATGVSTTSKLIVRMAAKPSTSSPGWTL